MKNRGHFSIDVGDVLNKPKFPFVHKGVYIGNGRVLHNTPERGEHISSTSDFAEGGPVSVTQTQHKDRTTLWQRIRTTISNPKTYDVTTNNCEHTVTRITKGREYSVQLWVVGALLTLTCFALITKK